jgi:hypothetical protein
VERLDDEAAARVEAALRRNGPGALGDFFRAVSLAEVAAVLAETDVEAALVACELSAALAGRPAPVLKGHPSLVAWVDEWRRRWPSFGSVQLGEPHSVARQLRQNRSSVTRDRAVAAGRELRWDAELDELIVRLTPRPQVSREWWELSQDITLSVVTGVSAVEVATRLGVDPSGGTLVRFHEVWDGHEYDGVHLAAQIDQLEGRTLIIEPIGWLMSDDDRAGRLSVGGSLVSVYWNSLMRVVVAVDGEVIRSFDPGLFDQPGIGEPLLEEGDLPFGEPGACRAAAVTLQERLSGLRLTADWLLEQPHPTWYGIPT